MKYWGEDQEAAIVEFNTNEDIEQKHQVFIKVIDPAFRKLVENIYSTSFQTILEGKLLRRKREGSGEFI